LRFFFLQGKRMLTEKRKLSGIFNRVPEKYSFQTLFLPCPIVPLELTNVAA